MKVNQKTQIKFLLDDFTVEGVTISPPKSKIIKTTRKGMEIKSSIKILEKVSSLIIGLTINIKIIQRKKESVVGSMTTNTKFKITDLEQYIEPGGKITLPKDFLKNLMGISYSTSRGAFSILSKGISSEICLLPLIDPMKILPVEMGKQNEDKI